MKTERNEVWNEDKTRPEMHTRIVNERWYYYEKGRNIFKFEVDDEKR